MNVYVSTIEPPRIARNKRIYGGNTFINTNEGGEQAPVAAQHFENDKLIELSIATVTVEFGQPFSIKPVIVQLKVWRMVNENGLWQMQDVYHYFPIENWLTETGFSLIVDEPLTGVIIDYCFTE